MRNLLEYPVTEQEICDLLLRLKGECDPDLVGDMTPVLLEQARQIVHAAYDMQRGIDERLEQERWPLKYATPWDKAKTLCLALRGENVYE